MQGPLSLEFLSTYLIVLAAMNVLLASFFFLHEVEHLVTWGQPTVYTGQPAFFGF